MTTQNLWDAAKTVLRGKFIAIQSYLKKQEKHRIDNLTLYLKQLEKEEQKTPKISRRKEIKDLSRKEVKQTIVKIMKTKSLFFEKINKIDNPLARFIKKKKREESHQQNQKSKRVGYNGQCRNIKDYQRLL